MISHYRGMEILASVTEDEIAESFLSIVWHGLKYFNLTGIGAYEFWLTSLVSKATTPNRI